MKKIVTKSLEKTNAESTKEVDQILNKKLGSNIGEVDFSKLWNAKSFMIDQFDLYKSSNEETQNLILSDLAEKRFLEAYNIEKAGMSFSAKMSLLSESINEQKLYSLFSSEEAIHFDYIQKIFKGRDIDYTLDPFIKLLNEIILSGERRPLIFIIQVLLEGWGIDHYALMEKSCLNTEVAGHLKQILHDEAAHHSSGVSLFNEGDLTDNEMNYITEMMSSFLSMVTCGPLTSINVLNKHLGEFDQSNFFEASHAWEDTQRKLDYLKKLMVKSKATSLLNRFESKGLFKLQF